MRAPVSRNFLWLAVVVVIALLLGERRKLNSTPFVLAQQNAASQTPSLVKEKQANDVTTEETPIGAKWWPSRWGADDQRGAANLMSAERALAASKLIRTGQIYQLGRVYERDMPTFPHRTFRLTIPAFRTARGANQQIGRDEFFVGEIGQMGTQMDGLGHVGCRLADGDTYYNGVRSQDMEDAYGLTKLGIENAGVFFTRGVLVDVAGARKMETLPVGYEISLAEFQATLDAQKLEIHQGDVVLIRTGHGNLRHCDGRC
jgi:hypothetical protein